MTTETNEREWLQVGIDFNLQQAVVDRYGRSREDFERAIVTEADTLTWHQVPDDGVIKGPMSPVMMLQAVIEQLGLRPVVGYAFGGVLEYPDGPETATYSLLGVEVKTRQQHFRLVLLDTGLNALPLFMDTLG